MVRVKRASLREGLKEDGTQFTHTLGNLEQTENDPTIFFVCIDCILYVCIVYNRTQSECCLVKNIYIYVIPTGSTFLDYMDMGLYYDVD